jgi:hypothetical protein
MCKGGILSFGRRIDPKSKFGKPAFESLFGRKVMSKVDELKAEIERLPEEEFTELVRWLSEKDWERWDKEIEADSKAGKLDFLVREALDAKAKGTLKDL